MDVQDLQTIASESGFAVDDIRFDNCAYDLPSVSQCPFGQEKCTSNHCYPTSGKCDYQPDCCDGTDEQTCGKNKENVS